MKTILLGFSLIVSVWAQPQPTLMTLLGAAGASGNVHTLIQQCHTNGSGDPASVTCTNTGNTNFTAGNSIIVIAQDNELANVINVSISDPCGDTAVQDPNSPQYKTGNAVSLLYLIASTAGGCHALTFTSTQDKIATGATYTSGGSIMGTSTQTCTVTASSSTNATWTVALTGTNTIAGGTTMTQTSAGAGFSSAPTTATLSNGTATCSGTATIVSALRGVNADLHTLEINPAVVRDTSAGAVSATNNTSPSGGSLTTALANEFLVAMFASASSFGTVTQPSGFTALTVGGGVGGAGYDIVTSQNTYPCTYTITSAVGWSALCAAYK